MGLLGPILGHFLPPSKLRIQDSSEGAPECLVSLADQKWIAKDSDLFAA
jgi:hypothetical protein